MNHSTVVYLKHALVPSKREAKPFVGRSLAELDPKWERPYVCLVDGRPVLRKDWDLRVYRGQVVTFVDVEALPAGGGGGGSNPVRIVAMIVVMLVAIAAQQYWAAGLATTLGVSTATAESIIFGTVMIVGSALVNVLLPAEAMGLSSNSSQTPSPTYSLQAQGNMARLGAAIPEHFGRMAFYPDFAAQPYQEFAGNDQFIYQLLCVGVGKYDIEYVGIEDTPISEFEEITYEIVAPGEQLDLFPANVITSPEVAGQEMAYNTYTGEFVVNAAGTTANYLGFDFLTPRGLFHSGSSGLNSATITWNIEACQIDDDAVEVGSWTVLESVSITKATATPQRISKKYAVTPGRYKGRVKRTNAQETGTSWAHEIVWAGFRAYLQDTRDYGNVTLIGMRMKATSQLSATSARKVKLIATRKLPLWTGAAWTAETATRDIAPALAYMCKSVGLPDNRNDLAGLYELDLVWKARGDEFNGRFDNTITWWEAITKAARAGRAKPFQQGGVMRVVRDQAQELPVCMFTMRDITPGSFSQKFLMPTSDTADSVEATYFDSGVWRNREVLVGLPGSLKQKSAKVEYFGITKRSQAANEAIHDAACNKYRRRIISFGTEKLGFIPSFMDLVAIQHDAPAWGQGGEVVAWDNTAKVATLSEPLSWNETPGTDHYISFTRANGAPQGPYRCEPGADAYQVHLIQAPLIQPYTGTDYERSRYSFGWGDTIYQLARVLSATPRSRKEVVIEVVNEDPNVHTAELDLVVPSPETSQLPREATAPVVRGLVIRSAPEDISTAVCSWEPTPWANSYIVQQCADGESWSTVGEPSTPDISFKVLYGNATIIRVAAVGVARGPWVTAAFGDSADYMWNAAGTTLMWNAVDTTEMWKF